MNTMIKNGFAAEVLPNFPPIVDIKDADSIPRENLFMLATGSQGERRAATAQLAGQSYMGFRLKEGDTFLFSSKTIPGNEKSVAWILNRMSETGVNVIEDDSRYHVSGHANGPDLATVHQLLKPQNVIPMHGEHRHLRAHAALAGEGGFPAVVAPNGTMVDLTGERAEIIDSVESGRTYLDGKILIGAMDGIVRARMRMALRGHVIVSLLMEPDGRPSDTPWVHVEGLPDVPGKGEMSTLLEAEIDEALDRAKRTSLKNDEAVEKLVEKAVRVLSDELIGKKPVVTVMINRFEPE